MEGIFQPGINREERGASRWGKKVREMYLGRADGGALEGLGRGGVGVGVFGQGGVRAHAG